MTEALWLLVLNSAAGFYSASLWGFFAWLRFRSRRWVWFVVDVVLAGCSAVVGIAYLDFGFLGGDPPTWLRWMVAPILVFSVSLHLGSWIRARKFISEGQT